MKKKIQKKKTNIKIQNKKKNISKKAMKKKRII